MKPPVHAVMTKGMSTAKRNRGMKYLVTNGTGQILSKVLDVRVIDEFVVVVGGTLVVRPIVGLE